MQNTLPRHILLVGASALILGLLAACAGTPTGPAGLQPEPAALEEVKIRPASDAVDDAHTELLFEVLAGEIAGQLGSIEIAAEHYNRAAGQTDDPAVAERALRISLYSGDSSLGLKATQRWAELDPDNQEALLSLAILYVRNDRTEEALPHFDKVVERASGEKNNGFLLIGSELAREENRERAHQAMQLLVERHADDPYAHFAHANLALRADEFELAADAAGRAVELKPDLIDAIIVRARALMAQEKPAAALDTLSTAIAGAPDSYPLRVAYARMLTQAERFEEARGVFSELVAERPNDTDLLFTLGLLNMQEEYYDDALANFRQLSNTPKRRDEANYYLGRVNEDLKRYDDALRSYLQVGAGEYQLDAQIRVANVYYETDGIDRAREHFAQTRKSISDTESLVGLYLAEGRILRESEQYDVAMEHYNGALIDLPKNGDLLYARALIAEKLDRVDLLEADLLAILEEDPDNATALNALGYTLADRTQRTKEALGYIERALSMRPKDPAVIDSMGWVHYRLGNYTEAETYLRKAFELLPDAEIAGHLGELMWKLGNTTEAVSVIKQALEENPDSRELKEMLERFTQ